MDGGRRVFARLPGLAAALVGLAACATSPGAASGRSAPGAPEPCFDTRNAESFSPLGERFVYLRTLGGHHYLLTLDGVYNGLPFATGIAITHGFRTVCSSTLATLGFTSFGRAVRCRIVRIDAVSGKDAARELARQRTGPR